MLTHLHISDFTLVDTLELELNKGLCVFSGETGAGKSIMLDALSLALGAKAEGGKVRSGCKKADIHASFDLSRLKFARKWLADQELTQAEQENECIMRRLVAADGRSRSFINGHTVTLQQLRALGSMLVDVHSQHEHQSLLKPQTQRRLLDEFGGLSPLAKQVREAYRHWSEAAAKLAEISAQSDEINARFQLLRYQVDELDQLALEECELSQLEQKQKTLANAEQIQHSCQSIISICSSENGLLEQLHRGLHLFRELPEKAPRLCESESLFESALVQVQEAQNELDRHLDSDINDAALLQEIETRLSAVYEVARKHRTSPELLVELHQKLAAELAGLQSGDEQLEELERQVSTLFENYTTLAQELSQRRQFAASRLDKAINARLSELAMEHAHFSTCLHPVDTPNMAGDENIEFLISTNPGQALEPLVKIASGGELSRISLAIQVVTGETSTTPTMVFDEVDVGIGGATGDVVGNLLRELGDKGQVICVTHLAQVACKALNHYVVNKEVNKKSATSSLTLLNKETKVAEIARMMGGDTESKQSLAHARQMLKAC